MFNSELFKKIMIAYSIFFISSDNIYMFNSELKLVHIHYHSSFKNAFQYLLQHGHFSWHMPLGVNIRI